MKTKKAYIAPALSLFTVQTEEGYAGSKLFMNAMDEDFSNGQQNWKEGDDWSGDGDWTWSD